MWINKYRPSSVEEMVGNEDARVEFVSWLLNWKVGVKPVLLLGPPGVGKTTLVKVCVEQYGLDLIELNASDVRTKERIESIVNPLITNKSISGKRVLLFLDEVDGIHGNADRGGLNALLSFVKEGSVPIAMAANKEDNLKELMKECKVIRFNYIPPRLMFLYLNEILKKERITVDIGDKIYIVRNSKGDMRNLLNSVNSLIVLNSKGYEKKAKKELALAIERFFNAKSIEEAKEELIYSEGYYYDPRTSYYQKVYDKLYMLFSSVINSTNDLNKLASILRTLSYIDTLIGRMNTTKEWRMLRYIDTLLAISLFDKVKGFTYNPYDLPYNLTNKIFNYSRSINSFVSELADRLHTSKRKLALLLPYILLFILKGRLREFLENNNMDSSIADDLEALVHGEES